MRLRYFGTTDHYDLWNMTVNSVGACVYGGIDGNKTISGSEFSILEDDGAAKSSFTAESMTSSATKIILTGVWEPFYGGLFQGIFTKNI